MSAIKQYYCGDCLEIMAGLPDKSVDLVFGSPPYEDVRTYGIDFNLKGQAWVNWMVQVYIESLRVCKGLVAFVVQGGTRSYRWSCTPALLITDLHRSGICVREGPWHHRIGIPGSGSSDWLRHDVEFIISATNGGKLLWSDNTAMGHPPIWGPGGAMSNRKKDGSRTPNKVWQITSTCGYKNGDTRVMRRGYTLPERVNPGNLISCGAVGGGHLGSKLAHENEAPFSEKIADFMIRSFCKPNGRVLDPFAGSGTVGAAALKAGRRFCLIDIRQSQIQLCKRRIVEAYLKMEETHGYQHTRRA